MKTKDKRVKKERKVLTNKAYNYPKKRKTGISRYEVTEGEMLEQKVERIVTNKEPISDGAPVVYRDRKEGVNQATDIRTDRFEVAIEAMDKVSKTVIAKRQELLKSKEEVIGDKSTDTSEQVNK